MQSVQEEFDSSGIYRNPRSVSSNMEERVSRGSVPTLLPTVTCGTLRHVNNGNMTPCAELQRLVDECETALNEYVDSLVRSLGNRSDSFERHKVLLKCRAALAAHCQSHGCGLAKRYGQRVIGA